MASLREIKRHIASVQSISKITGAMEVVAEARIRRLRAREEATTAFALRSWQVLNHLAAAAEDEGREDPVFTGYADVSHIGILLITSGRGLVGAYNENVISLAIEFAQSQSAAIEMITVGRTGREAMLRRGYPIHADFASEERLELHDIAAVAQVILDGFEQRTFENVVMAYTQFGRGTTLRPTLRQLLPLTPSEMTGRRNYIYEPQPKRLLDALLPRIIRFQIYHAYLEAVIAENAARRAAMHAATQNADDLIAQLHLGYNKARQEHITAELMDILPLQGRRVGGIAPSGQAWGGSPR